MSGKDRVIRLNKLFIPKSKLYSWKIRKRKIIMTNGDKWIVEWIYSPADYFERPVEISSENYNLTINDGKVKATTSQDPRPYLYEQLEVELEYRLQGAQLVSKKPYKLSKHSIDCIHSNGNRTLFIEGTSEIKVSTHADLTIINKNGTIVANTRVERIERKKLLSNLAVKHGSSDSLAKELLLHYSKAINDRDHFLVHLYDIIEGLKRQFGKEQIVRNLLNISKAQFNTLRRLANDAPLREGRHRARTEPSELRNATTIEWDTAMNIAAEIVEKYLIYLD